MGANCDRAGKHPATSHGHYDASCDPSQLAVLFAAPYRNVAIATGSMSGIAVIDIDPRHSGDVAWREYCELYPEMRTDTYTIGTGSDGLHLYFSIHPDERISSHIGLLSGVDLKAEGGYVVAPPSQHISGGVYRTLNAVPLLPFPEELRRMIASGERPAGLRSSPPGRLSTQGITSVRQREILEDPTSLREGERDTFFTFTARDMVRAGRSPQEILDALGRVYDEMSNRDSFNIETVAQKIQRALNDIPEHERTDPILRAHFQAISQRQADPDDEPAEAVIVGEEYFTPREEDEEEEPGTAIATTPFTATLQLTAQVRRDLPAEVLHHWDGNLPTQWDASARGMADLANEQYGELIRYVRELDQWICWEPRVRIWQPDAAIEVRRLIQGSIDSLRLIAIQSEDEDLRNDLLDFATRMSWPGNVKAVLDTLQTDHATSVNELNNHYEALPVENGIIDPSLGLGDSYDDVTLHELAPGWLFTKHTRLHHSDEQLSRAPFWAKSIERWFPDPDVREFAQRLMGYSVFGRGQEKAFVIAYGKRDSGKSAFFNNMAYLLHDFAVTISPEALMEQRYENEANYGLSHIGGARLYVSSETKPGARLNSALLKRFASGGSDSIRTRALRENFVDIIPRGLLIMMTNHVPYNEQLDEALWSRTIILPFDGSFPADSPQTIKDAQLQQLLIAERDGILLWLVEGYSNYNAIGLRRPKAIANALELVKQEQDWATPFVQMYLQPDHGKKVLRKQVRLAYEAWCLDSGEEPLPERVWAAAMRETLGAATRGTGGKHYYRNWRLRDEFSQPDVATELPPSLRRGGVT